MRSLSRIGAYLRRATQLYVKVGLGIWPRGGPRFPQKIIPGLSQDKDSWVDEKQMARL